MKLLFAHDRTNPLDETIQDLRRAGLPEYGKALVLSLRENHTGNNENAADGAPVARQIQSQLPGWEVSVESAPASADVVLRTATWWSPDLLIMGCPKKPESFSGNLAFDVVHRARCSVRMVTPSVANDGPIRLIVADDGTAGAQSAVRMVEKRTWPGETEVRVLTVGKSAHSGSPDTLRKLGLTVSEVCVDGDPGQALVREAEAWNSDAVFMGAHGASAANRFLLGSVSTAVVTRLRRTVEVVR